MTLSITQKTAVATPTLKASVSTTVKANPGDLRNWRNA
jgi:hypothetical protein